MKKVKKKSSSMIHPSAIIEDKVHIGKNVSIWHFVHIRTGSYIEDNVSLARDVYVDKDVRIKKGTRVQNGVSIYTGLKIGEYCFVGPHVIFTNDIVPRSTNIDWKVVPTVLKDGCSIGAGSIIICGITIHEFALVGAGSVVTQNIPAFHLAMGNPARVKKMICACGHTQFPLGTTPKKLLASCCQKLLKPEAVSLAKKAIKNLI